MNYVSFYTEGGMNLISNFKTAFAYKSFINYFLQYNGHVDKLYLNEKQLSNVYSEDDVLNTINQNLEWDQVFNPTFHLFENQNSIDFKYPIPLSYPTLIVNFDLRIKQAINRGFYILYIYI